MNNLAEKKITSGYNWVRNNPFKILNGKLATLKRRRLNLMSLDSVVSVFFTQDNFTLRKHISKIQLIKARFSVANALSIRIYSKRKGERDRLEDSLEWILKSMMPIFMDSFLRIASFLLNTSPVLWRKDFSMSMQDQASRSKKANICV